MSVRDRRLQIASLAMQRRRSKSHEPKQRVAGQTVGVGVGVKKIEQNI